ncbi:MAG: hypothetical protein LAP86_29075 [Acidobacteriia bacterium]|nr:hypothetical protein [Terriglobia bacterium]
MRTSERHAVAFQHGAERIFELQVLLTEIEGTKTEITKVIDGIGFFFPDEHKVRARDALKTRLDGLLKQLDEMCAKHA